MSENNNISRLEDVKKYFFRPLSADFKKIPGSPIAYWVSDLAMASFTWKFRADGSFELIQGMITGDNAKYVRYWYEISQKNFSPFSGNRNYWIPYNKGGQARKWYGNHDLVVDWRSAGKELLEFAASLYGSPTRTIKNIQHYFKESITWSALSGALSLRFNPSGFLFDTKGQCIFTETRALKMEIMCLLNSKPAFKIMEFLAPTLDFNSGVIAKVPFIKTQGSVVRHSEVLLKISKDDWDAFETSWDFHSNSLFRSDCFLNNLNLTYKNIRAKWIFKTLEMQSLEEENNRIFIDAYGLQDELTPDVPLNEITLTCNPYYRYGGDKTEEELEALLLADTMREFISYAVGCMFGRYALDKPGLVLANQGETMDDYRRLVPNSRFEADADNVIPMLDGEWFADDVTERFRQFLRVTFGDDHYDENLAFIEQALNPKGKRNYTLRDYMLGEFYTDHVKRYKKRPIYWLFSSPKGTFNALIYLHRYRPDTASVVLRYLREFRAKLAARQSTLEQVLINPATSQGEKTKAVKEIDTLKKQIIELQDYENDTLYPLATANVALDLDDGVKVNYLKLGAALKKITGLDAKDED
jgi:type II restriction/modification system DNA methylase subunit YeeA